MPKPYILNEVQKNVHGVVSTLNNFTGAILPQYWWVGR
jgi:peptide/nickel transport system substrate-binding protein